MAPAVFADQELAMLDGLAPSFTQALNVNNQARRRQPKDQPLSCHSGDVSFDVFVQAFGEPDDRLASDPSALIKYGDFELVFAEGVLTVVHCEFGSPPLPTAPDGYRLSTSSAEFSWPIDLDAVDATAVRSGLSATHSEEQDGSVTATYGPMSVELAIDRDGLSYYSMRMPEMARLMTSCWICSVPSKMSWVLQRGLRGVVACA